MRPGYTLAYPTREVGLPSRMHGPEEWQFTGPREQYFRENFGDHDEHLLDTLRDFWQTFKSGDYRARGRVVNAAVSLPKTPFYASVRQKLIRLVGGMSRASDEAIDRMFQAYGRLKPAELGLVNRVAFVRDMWEDVQTQLAEGATIDAVKLPEPWTAQGVHNELVRLNLAVDGAPTVKAALDARKAMWDNAVGEYSNAYEAVTGRRPNLSRRDYFRHEVFLYQLGKAGLRRGEGAASRVLPLPKRPSFLQQRRGTVLPYQTNLVDADHGVLAQMLYHAQMFRAWKEVLGYDIRPELEKQAAAWRLGHTTLDDPTQLDNLFSLQKVVDQLPDAPDGRHREFLEKLSNFDASATPEEAAELGREALHYTKWLRARLEGVPKNLEGKLPVQGLTAREAFQRNLRGEPTVTYRHLVPDGYREVTGVGNVLERAWKVHDVTDELLDLHTRAVSGALPPSTGEGRAALPASTAAALGPKPTGVLPGEVRMGVPYRAAPRYDTIVVPERLANVIEGMKAENLTGYRALMSVAGRRFMSGWKQWKLFNPLTVAGYQLRNLSGDAEAMFVGNPKAFLMVPRAVRELHGVLYREQSPSDQLRGFVERGGLSGIFASAEEVGDRVALDRFSKQLDRGRQIFTTELQKQYWKQMRLSNDWREATLRYADYLDTLQHVEQHGTLRNYGASVPEEILALEDPRDQAYKHANDLLGAFDEISVAGQYLRQGLMPFYSWKEVNAKRWYQLGRNAWDDPNLAGFVGRRVVGFAGARALAIGRFALKAAALGALLDSYNRFHDLEGEMSLPPDVRQRPHILLGRGPNGQVRYMSRLGALADLTSFFGVDNPHGFAYDWLNGRTLGELATQVQTGQKSAPRAAADFLLGPRASLAHAIVETLNSDVQDVGSMLAPPLQALSKFTGITIDPQGFASMPAADRAQALFNELGAGPLYRWLTPDAAPVRPGWPQRALGVGLVGYHEGAYTETRGWVSDYLRRFGDAKARAAGQDDPKTVALYQAAKAKRLGDAEAVNAHLLEYFASGGKMKDLGDAVRRMSPLGSAPAQTKGGYRREFLGRLTDQEWEQVVRGYDFYRLTWAPEASLPSAKGQDTAAERYAWTVTADALVRGSALGDLAAWARVQAAEAPKVAQEKASQRVGQRAGYVEGVSPPELRQ